MRVNATLKLVLVVFLCVGLGGLDLAAAAAGKSAAEAKTPQTGLEAATYAVPGLDADLARGLIKRLSKLEGLVSAKPDLEAGNVVVTFDPERVTPETIQEAMAEVAPEAELKKVGPAPHEHTAEGCGKCPKRHTCSKNKQN